VAAARGPGAVELEWPSDAGNEPPASLIGGVWPKS